MLSPAKLTLLCSFCCERDRVATGQHAPMAAPGPGVPPVLPTFDWHHEGSPDLKDPAVVAALPVDLKVHLSDVKHRFARATPCLSWTKVPGATPADPPIAIALDQDDLDLLCLVGGITIKWLRTQSNALLLSHVPSHADGLLAALIGLGGLDLDVTYYEKSPLLDAVTAAKLACGDDNRLRLGADAFFEDQPRPAIGSGSSAARN